MKQIKILLLLFIIVAGSSCEEPEKLVTTDPVEDKIELVGEILSNRQLQTIATQMTSFINNDEVRRELLTFATEETDYEVDRSFARIMAQTNEAGRYSSAFANNLEEVLSSCESCRFGNSTEDLLGILGDHYIVYAPYLAENFADSEDPMTISWWDGVDDSGYTEGILTSKAQTGRTDDFEIITNINDDYAEIYPTLVIRPIDEEDECGNIYRCSGGGGGTGGGSGDGGANTTPRDIDCRTLDEDMIFELELPKFRLHKNTRNWPNNNRLYMWAITGDFTVDANGFINTAPNIDDPWGIGRGQRVSRSNASDANWLGSNMSFLKSNWLKSQTELRIVVAHRKDWQKKINYTDKVAVNTEGFEGSNASAEFTIKSEKTALMMFNMSFNRCTVLGQMASEGDYGTKDGYHVYRFNDFSFYLRDDIR